MGSVMGFGKKRLYIGLYPSGVAGDEERRYDWGFIVGPKNEGGPDPVPGMRYHLKQRPVDEWAYEEAALANVKSPARLLARVLIAKVRDEARLVDIFRTTPVVQGDPAWCGRAWIADVLRRLQEDDRAVGTAVLDWAVVEPAARDYVGRKTADGRYAGAEESDVPKPTFDLLERRELLP